MRRIVAAATRALVPPSLAAAVGLLVHGYQGTGGGFAAGVVGGISAFLLFAALGRRTAERILPLGAARAIAAAGIALVLGVALVPVAFGYPPVTHFPAPGEHVTTAGAIELHTSLLFDAGVAVAVFGVIVTLVDLVAEEERS